MIDPSITKKQNIKRYASQFVHKLATKPIEMALHRLVTFKKPNTQNQLPSLQFENTIKSTTSSLSDEDEAPTPTDSMVSLDYHHHHSIVVLALDSRRDNKPFRTLSFSSSFDLTKKKESKAVAKWQSTVKALIIQRKVIRSMKHYVQKSHYTEKDEALSRFILNELYSTEKSFYQLLIYIQKTYMEPMVAALKIKDSLVKSSDVYVLFHFLPYFIDTSRKLLSRLEAIQDHSPGLAIGAIFAAMEPELAVFLKYAIHYQDHLKHIRKASNGAFIAKINNDKRNEHKRLGISDYLIAPFQRVPRYELLLKDLLKHTDLNENENESPNELVYADNLIHGLAATMNNV